MKLLSQFKACIAFLLCLYSMSLIAAQYDPGSGKTRLLIGQTFQQEYQDYLTGVNLTPQGSSHYATFYLGKIEQGDDNPNANFLDWVRTNNHGEYALIALSIKDNTAAGGYGQMTDNSGTGFNSNAIWDALNDINSGNWNNQIDDFAQIMEDRPNTKFLVRVGYEVSLLLFAYNGDEYVVDWLNAAANSGVNVFEDPDSVAEMDRHAYINAYNYIANRLRNVNNVSNVDFVYHPVRGFFDTKWLYPGDQFVDWVAFSVFNNDVCIEVNGTFNCQGQNVDPNLAQSVEFAQSHNKPIMVAEAAAQAPAANSDNGFVDYLNRLDNFIKTYDVGLLAYINSDWPSHGWGPEWGDSRVETRTNIRNHWLTTFGENTRYLHGDDSVVPPPSGGKLENGVVLNNLSANQGELLKFYIDLPQNASNLEVKMNDGNGDADLYVKFSQEPTSSDYDCRPYRSGNDETCSFQSPNAGRWFVNLVAYSNFSGVSLVASYETDTTNQLPLANANGPYNGTVNQTISFSSNGSADPDGSITQYRWEFGDGATSNQANPGHNYASAGNYSVVLTVTDNLGATSSASTNAQVSEQNDLTPLQNGVAVNGLSSAQGEWLKFYIDLPTGATNLQVKMSNGSGDADLYIDFNQPPTKTTYSCRPYSTGNNENCSEANPSNGRWYVFVRAYQAFSNVTLVASFTTNTGNQLPSANANGPYSTILGNPISFSSQGSTDPDGSITNYFWEFGDGNSSSQANPSHTYQTASTYTVMLTVTDDQGATNSSSTTATISEDNNNTSTYLAPIDGSTIFIVGQDLLSASEYANSNVPIPGGITTYVAFYDILNDSGANGIVNGALGFNTDDQPNNVDVDWGAGPLNAYNAAIGFPNSTLQIGLNIAEGNNGELWCGGCLAQIANGQRDAEIEQLGDFFNAISNTGVYLRIGYEFDGTWNNGYENSSIYKTAFQRIVTGLRAKGVSNVAYVWQSSASPIDDQIEAFHENISQWYPGNEFVDWVGLSWFLLPNEQPTVGGNPATQIQLANEVIDFARNNSKAVMIAEATPQGYNLQENTLRNISPVWDGAAGGGQQNLSNSQIWNQWFTPFFDYIHSNDDVIRAVSYINADWGSQPKWAPPYNEGYWGDTRVQANGTILNNWNNELNSNFWTHGSNSINQKIGLQ